MLLIQPDAYGHSSRHGHGFSHEQSSRECTFARRVLLTFERKVGFEFSLQIRIQRGRKRILFESFSFENPGKPDWSLR